MASKDPGTELVPFGEYAVAQFDTDMLKEAIEANIGTGDVSLDRDLDRVKIPGAGSTTWTIPTLEGEVESKMLDGIIVEWKQVRAYYATSFDDAPNSPPTCASDDSVTGFGFPFHKGSDEPEGEPIHLPCAQCPNSQWESAEKGKGQACNQNRLLFMLTQGDMLPIVVKLPPTSIKANADYFMRLIRGGKPFFAVQTRITLEKVKSAGNIDYAEARFERIGDLAPDDTQKVKVYREAIAPAVKRAQAHDPSEAPPSE
jgi:hypothetical protein